MAKGSKGGKGGGGKGGYGGKGGKLMPGSLGGNATDKGGKGKPC